MNYIFYLVCQFLYFVNCILYFYILNDTSFDFAEHNNSYQNIVLFDFERYDFIAHPQ